MRYPIQLVTPADAFGPETKIGVRLKNDAPIVVPDCPDCPDCPECPDCEPRFDNWAVTLASEAIDAQGASFACPSNGDPVLITLFGVESIFFPWSVTVFPIVERCKHTTRFSWENQDHLGATTIVTVTAPDPLIDGCAPPEQGFMLDWRPDATTFGGPAFVQLQIDLTDAPAGSETWTDFGCQLIIA